MDNVQSYFDSYINTTQDVQREISGQPHAPVSNCSLIPVQQYNSLFWILKNNDDVKVSSSVLENIWIFHKKGINEPVDIKTEENYNFRIAFWYKCGVWVVIHSCTRGMTCDQAFDCSEKQQIVRCCLHSKLHRHQKQDRTQQPTLTE